MTSWVKVSSQQSECLLVKQIWEDVPNCLTNSALTNWWNVVSQLCDVIRNKMYNWFVPNERKLSPTRRGEGLGVTKSRIWKSQDFLILRHLFWTMQNTLNPRYTTSLCLPNSVSLNKCTAGIWVCWKRLIHCTHSLFLFFIKRLG